MRVVMISDERLKELNYRGFIPGPLEKQEDFLNRVVASETLFLEPLHFFSEEERKNFSLRSKVKKPRWSWSRSTLLHLFDFSPDALFAFFDNHSLPFFQGGATWILEKEQGRIRVPLIQVRSSLEKKALFNLYTLEEILSHEAAHAARIAFDEEKYEEIFAYLTSSSFLRRIIGPLFSSSSQVTFFLILLTGMVLFQIGSLFAHLWFFSFGYLLFGFFLGSYICMIFGKLFWKRRVLKKAANNLFSIVKDKKTVRYILFRLTDEEIDQFASFSPARIVEYVQRSRKESLRWKMISLVYFPFL